MKPLLAAKIERESIDAELAKIQYPVIGSPKVDGIRVLCHPELGPVTRKFKPVPNHYTRRVLQDPLLHYFDGEVTVGEPNVSETFNRTTRGIMSREGEPYNFTFWIFDYFKEPDQPYWSRLEQLKDRLKAIGEYPRVQLLESHQLYSPQGVLEYETHCLDRGFEGICFRHMNGPYKFNRSTLREQTLIKLKHLQDDEAIVLRTEQRQRNDNPAERDALGYTKRSSHKDNKIDLEMVGRLICKSPSFTDEFGVGSGFDHQTASLWYHEPEQIVGKTITFRYQPCGTIDKPRHPIFKGIRED